MRAVALGDAHGEEDCPREGISTCLLPLERSTIGICLVVMYDILEVHLVQGQGISLAQNLQG